MAGLVGRVGGLFGRGDGGQGSPKVDEKNKETPRGSASPRVTLGSARSSEVSFGTARTSQLGSSRSPRFTARSPLSGVSKRSTRKRPARVKIIQQLKPPAETGGLARIRARFQPEITDEDELKVKGQDGEDEEEDEEDWKDIVDELCLTVEPQVEELGDAVILQMKKAGNIDIEDEDVMQRFKRHKSRQGRIIFEAENANNVGVEYFSFGDVDGAAAYFKKALELVSKEIKPAAKELAEFKEFIMNQYFGDMQAFYSALSDGEWRLALGRRRFVTVMKQLNYVGDAERLFSMLDVVSGSGGDGKVTMTEVESLLRTKGVDLNHMDNELVQRGVVLNNIGSCHIQHDDPIVGLKKLREALGVIRRNSEHGEDDPLAQRVMCNIAVAYIRMGDIDCALNFAARVLARRETLNGILDPDALNALYLSGYCFLVKANRFDIMYDRKRMDKRTQENPVEVNYKFAQCAFKERLRRQQEILDNLTEREEGEDGTALPGQIEQLRLDIARSHEIVAEIHDKRRQLDRALPHLRSAVVHKEAVLGESDPELLSTWNTLASVCMRAGSYEEALDLMEKAIAATAVLFGDSSLTVATEMFHLGLVYFRMASELGKDDRVLAANYFDLAIEKLIQTKEMQVDILGEEDADVAATAQLLGSVYLAANNRREARRNFERALLIRVEIFGRSHLSTASSAQALGILYARTPRRQEEAIQLLRKAMLIREKFLGSESLYLADSLHELGSVLLLRRDQKDYDTALQYLSKAAKIREQRLGKESLKYAASMHQVGQAHTHLGLCNEARLYLQAALALRERMTPKTSAQVAMTRFALGVTLLRLGDISAAMKQLRLAYSAREALYGQDHAQSASCLHQIGMAHFKNAQSEASLPFFHRALEIRMRLNTTDAEARQDDSDEDPKDLKRHTSSRDRRIQKERDRLAKAQAKEERKRNLDKKRVEEEKRRESRRQELEQEKMKAINAEQDQGKSKKRATSFSSILFGLRSKGRKSGEDALAGVQKQEDDLEFPDEGDEEGSDPSDEDLTPGRTSARSSSRKGQNTTMKLQSRGGRGRRASGVVEKVAVDDEVRSNGSDVCMDDIGVDIHGWLAGEIGQSMLTIGVVYMGMEEYTKSRRYLRNAMCICEEVFGIVSPENGEAMHAYGVLNEKQEQYVGALKYFREALHIREKACGHSHEATATSCVSMADVLVALGHPDDAGIYLIRGINIREDLFGSEDELVIALKEKWSKLAAGELQYDPVKHGESVPHFSRRSPESYLHGFADKQTEEASRGFAATTGVRGGRAQGARKTEWDSSVARASLSLLDV